MHQARKRLVKALQAIVDQRREGKEGNLSGERRDLMDLLLEAKDETGRKLYDEEIIDIILMYLNAGHESSAHATMWATLFLHQNPEYYQKAKVCRCRFSNSNMCVVFKFCVCKEIVSVETICLETKLILSVF